MKVALAVVALLALAATAAAYWWFRAPAHGLALSGAMKVRVVPRSAIADAGTVAEATAIADAGVADELAVVDAGSTEAVAAGGEEPLAEGEVQPDLGKTVIGVNVDAKFGGHILFLVTAGNDLQPVPTQESEEKARELEPLCVNRKAYPAIGGDGGSFDCGISPTLIEDALSSSYWVVAGDMLGDIGTTDPSITAERLAPDKVNHCPEKNHADYTCDAGPVHRWRLLRAGAPIGELRVSSFDEAEQGTEEGGGMNNSVFVIDWKPEGGAWRELERLAEGAGC